MKKLPDIPPKLQHLIESSNKYSKQILRRMVINFGEACFRAGIAAAHPPAWVDALKGKDPMMDDLIAYAEQLEAERDSYKVAADLAVESQNQAQSDAELAERRAAELAAVLEEWESTNKVDELQRECDRRRAQVSPPVGTVVAESPTVSSGCLADHLYEAKPL